VKVVSTYDRSELIEASIDTLKHELIAEMIIVSLVILVFLWHIHRPSSHCHYSGIGAPIFIPMHMMG